MLESAIRDLTKQMKKVVTFNEGLASTLIAIEGLASTQIAIDQKLRIISDQTAVEKRILTPSDACLSANTSDFTRLVTLLRLADSARLSEMIENFAEEPLPQLPKFAFKWKTPAVDAAEGEITPAANKEKSLERQSYRPLIEYLESLSMCAVDVSDGQKCQGKNMFDSEVHTIRPNTILNTVTLMKTSQCPFLIQQLRGRTDVAIIAEKYAAAICVTKFQIRVAIEVKTVALMNSIDACLREAAVQLIGINTENIERSPPVLLTNLVGRHYCLYLTCGDSPEVHLEYKMRIIQFETFEEALSFALQRGDLPPVTAHFGRRPTPPASEAGEGSSTN